MSSVLDIVKSKNITSMQVASGKGFKQAYKRPSKQAMSARLFRIGEAFGKESGGVFDELRQQLLEAVNGIQILESGRISLSSFSDDMIAQLDEILPTVTSLKKDAKESLDDENASEETIKKEVNEMFGNLEQVVRVILQHWYEFQQDNPELRKEKYQAINEKLSNIGKKYSFRDLARIVNDEIKPILSELGIDLSDVKLISRSRETFDKFMHETYVSGGNREIIWTGKKREKIRLTKVNKIDTWSQTV